MVQTRLLSASTRADVVIVGAGITGALIAEAATGRGLSTVIIDRRAPGHGSTAASTALLQFEIDTPLTHLADQIGAERASRAWLRSFRAVDDLTRLVARLGIRCQLRTRKAIYLSGNKLNADELAREGRARRSIGLPSEWLDCTALAKLAGIQHRAALVSLGAADVNPVGLTGGLFQWAMSKGCRLLSPVQLAEVFPSTKKVAMATADGIEIEAKALVFATGYELAEGVPTAGHRLASTWAFATAPQPDRLWGEGELIWEASDPYLYIRTTSDGRAVIGGEDQPIVDEAERDALLPVKVKTLQGKGQELFPQLGVDAEYAWTGTFGESATGLPSVGAVPGMPNCFAVLGYGGNGLTFSMMARQVIVALLSGECDPDAEIFAFR